jgi:hypothetical protein
LRDVTVYRGVAGRGSARRVRGLSWTFSLEVAAWFAHRGSTIFRLPDPAVYQLIVPEHQVLAYSDGRREGELLVLCDASSRPRRCLSPAEIEHLAEQRGAAVRAENVAKLEALRRR